MHRGQVSRVLVTVVRQDGHQRVRGVAPAGVAPTGSIGHESVTPAEHAGPVSDTEVISCDDCCRQDSDHCRDCVVNFICDRAPGDAVVVDVAEVQALRLLGESGLVPRLRHLRRTG